MRYVVLYPIEGLPQGKVYGGETVYLDDETAAPLVGVAALRPVVEEPEAGPEVVYASIVTVKDVAEFFAPDDFLKDRARPTQEEPTHDEEVIAASPEAQGNEAAAEPPRTVAKQAPAKGRGKK